MNFSTCFTSRRWLALAAVTGLSLSAVGAAADDIPEGYREAYDGLFRVGVALSREQIMGEQPGILAQVAHQFNAVTPENDMKWERIEPEENQFQWEVPDALVAFAAEHDMEVTGHTLLWHSQTPDWVFEKRKGKPADRELLLGRLENHINNVVGRYKGKVAAWDVVNEALNEDGSLRESPWLEILGPGYIAEAFRMAHEADPDAELIYNDYNLFKPEKRAGAVRIVQELQEQGVPIHAVGMQAHYSLGYPENLEEVVDSIKAFAALGVSVKITELDVSVLPFPDEADQGADVSQDLKLKRRYNPFTSGLPEFAVRVQDEMYRNLFRIFIDNADAVSRVTFWGVNDAHSWRNNWPMQGRTDYPLLLDRESKPKPVMEEIIEMGRSARRP